MYDRSRLAKSWLHIRGYSIAFDKGLLCCLGDTIGRTTGEKKDGCERST
jgi:hypothetical protein